MASAYGLCLPGLQVNIDEGNLANLLIFVPECSIFENQCTR